MDVHINIRTDPDCIVIKNFCDNIFFYRNIRLSGIKNSWLSGIRPYPNQNSLHKTSLYKCHLIQTIHAFILLKCSIIRHNWTVLDGFMDLQTVPSCRTIVLFKYPGYFSFERCYIYTYYIFLRLASSQYVTQLKLFSLFSSQHGVRIIAAAQILSDCVIIMKV